MNKNKEGPNKKTGVFNVRLDPDLQNEIQRRQNMNVSLLVRFLLKNLLTDQRNELFENVWKEFMKFQWEVTDVKNENVPAQEIKVSNHRGTEKVTRKNPGMNESQGTVLKIINQE